MDDLFGNGSRSAAHTANAHMWDTYARTQRRFARPVTDKEFAQRVQAVTSDPFLEGHLVGRRLLCLGSGGGMQSALYAAAGANVTVVDISPEMLALDREVAAERGLMLTTLEASIDALESISAAQFETVIQPVSSCYVPDVEAVYREVARVTCAGGLYVSQHKQPGSLQASANPGNLGYLIESPYYRPGPLPAVSGSPHREEGTFEFLHRLEPLLGVCVGVDFALKTSANRCMGLEAPSGVVLRIAVGFYPRICGSRPAESVLPGRIPLCTREAPAAACFVRSTVSIY